MKLLQRSLLLITILAAAAGCSATRARDGGPAEGEGEGPAEGEGEGPAEGEGEGPAEGEGEGPAEGEGEGEGEGPAEGEGEGEGPEPGACDDGTEVVCLVPEPECGPGELLAVQGGCWLCVNPATCRPWGEPGCSSQADCPVEERCDFCATGSCAMCADCVAACLPHDCDTEPEAVCDMVRPDCGDRQVSVVRDGCWVCVHARTCEVAGPAGCEELGGYCAGFREECKPGFVGGPPRDCPNGRSAQCCEPHRRPDHCDDGAPLTCRMMVPQCPPGEVPAIQGGCYVCVDAETCEPREGPGCLTDLECPPDAWCDPCARPSGADRDDCVAGCLPHGCRTEPEPRCNMLRPDCGEGQVAVVLEGCWVCVDRVTCLPVPDTECEAAGGYCADFQERCDRGYEGAGPMDCPAGQSAQCCLPARDERCDDGSEWICDMEAPECQEGSIPALIEGCWQCVNPATCRPWGEPGCAVDADCPPADWCNPCGTASCPMCRDCRPACDPHGCPTEREAVCNMIRPACDDGQVAVVRDGCWVCLVRDTCEPPPQGEDCEAAGGYCEHWQQPCREDFESGHPMDCPGGRSAQCCLPARDESCDDGRDVVCAMVPPVCEPFEILAAQGGCWVCVNPATCLPWGEPGCERDADCPADARCDPCGTAACPDCDACAAACTPHRCETALEAACDMERPDCEDGQVAVVRDACWVCVELRTCEPPPPGALCEAADGYCEHFVERCRLNFHDGPAMDCPGGRSAKCCLPGRDRRCDDGTELRCDELQPRCGEFDILAIREGCWVCANPATCRPWGEPGCDGDMACGPSEWCDPCGTSGCPLCENCVAACRPHGCASEADLMCWCARPECGDRGVAVIRDGCWICVDAETCRALPDAGCGERPARE